MDSAPRRLPPVVHQGRPRALLKTLLYRLLMVVVTVVVALLVTGDLVTSLNIGIAANLVKMVAYYVYERAWDRIDWGLVAQ